ncbi:MAG: NAD(P)H-dependent oxidoreductase subunit E [Chloroflexota bacterium]
MAVPDFDIAPLDIILDEFKSQKGAIIPILQRAQEAYGYLPKDILLAIAKKTGISVSRLYGVATFYAQFHLSRRGRHLIRVCDGTACHVRGATKIVAGLEEALNIPPGGTDSDYKYTMEIVYCLGSCGLAPIAVVNDQVYGQTDADSLVEKLHQLE